MARQPRNEVFSPEEINTVHVMNRVVRRCLLMGTDDFSGKNYDHRKKWIEEMIEGFAASFGIDLLTFSILSNHFHLVLRSRPDVVATWDDWEVARRWFTICPKRKNRDGTPKEPSEAELKSIAKNRTKLKETRLRLSNISWWMRLLCQRIAQRANKEDEASGKFWENRFRGVRILDEIGLLACSAYVDLNPIRAALAQTLETSDHTSVQRRIEGLKDRASGRPGSQDKFLAPLTIDELRDALGPDPSKAGFRCSDKGYLNMSLEAYLELLDWTARQTAPGKAGTTPASVAPILERLSISGDTWSELARDFGRLFSLVAGRPTVIDATPSRMSQRRFHARQRTRELLSA